MRNLLIILSFILVALSSWGRDYFVSPHGNDASDGSKRHPFASLRKAQEMVSAGDNVWLMGGTYRLNDADIMHYASDSLRAYVFNLDKSGTAEAPITYSAWNNEKVVFELSGVRPNERRVVVFNICAYYLHLRGFEVVGTQVTITSHTQSECFRISRGSHNILEKLSVHDGMAVGFYLVDGAYNTIEGCDAYNNADTISTNHMGGNVDGFGAHLVSAECVGNVFRKCRAWYNSDDGFDLIRCWAPVVIDSCLACCNGYMSGSHRPMADGTGIKAGGFGMKGKTEAPSPAPRHVISNCIAYGNKKRGFYANYHPGGLNFMHNIAIGNNENYNFTCRKSSSEVVAVDGYGHVLSGNVSIAPGKAGAHFIRIDSTACDILDNKAVDNVDDAPSELLQLIMKCIAL